MKILNIVCLVAVVVAALQSPAEAGRRAARRVARRTTAVVAGVAAGTAAGAAVGAAARRSTTVVAAVPVVARTGTGYVAALPDLIVDDVTSDRGVLVITVKNIGRASSPLTQLAIELCRPTDGLLVGSHTSRVLPLAVNQSVQIRIHSAPLDDVRVSCVADPLGEVPEMSELNNSRAMTFAPLPALPPTLQDEAEWQQPSGESSETIAPGRPM